MFILFIFVTAITMAALETFNSILEEGEAINELALQEMEEGGQNNG